MNGGFEQIRATGKAVVLLPLVFVLFLGGCATRKIDAGVEVKNVPAAAAKVPLPVVVLENTSRLVLKSTGMPMDVDFFSGTPDEACREVKRRIGTVRDKGEGVLLPWIAKLSEKLNRLPGELETIVPAREAIKIAGYGHWFDGQARGHCGPVMVAFVPDEKHSYLVEFVWRGTSECTTHVFDVTDPVERKTVSAQAYTCPPSLRDILPGRVIRELIQS